MNEKGNNFMTYYGMHWVTIQRGNKFFVLKNIFLYFFSISVIHSFIFMITHTHGIGNLRKHYKLIFCFDKNQHKKNKLQDYGTALSTFCEGKNSAFNILI